MAVDAVSGVEAAPLTVASRGRLARLRELGPFLPAGLLVGVLFFIPLAVMFVFSLWETNANLDIVPTWTLNNYGRFFESSAYVRTLTKTVIMGVAGAGSCLGFA